jgi:hypothetical protein
MKRRTVSPAQQDLCIVQAAVLRCTAGKCEAQIVSFQKERKKRRIYAMGTLFEYIVREPSRSPDTVLMSTSV